MSRIYFHSPSGEVEISGPERHWMGRLTEDVAGGLIVSRGERRGLAKLLPVGSYPLESLEPRVDSFARFAESLSLWMRFEDSSWVVEGERYNAWMLGLNTCLAVGSDPLKLCARLHGQCEIHAFVEGPNRAWLAGIIRDGLASGVMRGPELAKGDRGPYDPGWAALTDWLESRDDEPVVTSYSVCEGFPNRGIAGWESDDDEGDGGDSWYALGAEKRWELAMAGLRKRGPELKPDGWSDYRFGHGKDAFWLMSQVG